MSKRISTLGQADQENPVKRHRDSLLLKSALRTPKPTVKPLSGGTPLAPITDQENPASVTSKGNARRIRGTPLPAFHKGKTPVTALRAKTALTDIDTAANKTPFSAAPGRGKAPFARVEGQGRNKIPVSDKEQQRSGEDAGDGRSKADEKPGEDDHVPKKARRDLDSEKAVKAVDPGNAAAEVPATGLSTKRRTFEELFPRRNYRAYLERLEAKPVPEEIDDLFGMTPAQVEQQTAMEKHDARAKGDGAQEEGTLPRERLDHWSDSDDTGDGGDPPSDLDSLSSLDVPDLGPDPLAYLHHPDFCIDGLEGFSSQGDGRPAATGLAQEALG